MIIAFEGPDRVGKATQSKLLQKTLSMGYGFNVSRVEIPYKDGVGIYTTIYWMLKNGLAKKFPNVFQTLHFLNKKFFEVFHLNALLKTKDVVILDRWQLSSVVYGKHEGVSDGVLSFTTKNLAKPDVTVIFLNKRFTNEVEDVYEADGNMQDNVRKLYDAEQIEGKVIKVRDNKPQFATHNEILEQMTDVIDRLNKELLEE